MRRNHTAHFRRSAITEGEAVTYLLDIPEKVFKLHIKSTDILFSSTIGDGSCGFRALRQASKRAAIPDNRRGNMPITKRKAHHPVRVSSHFARRSANGRSLSITSPSTKSDKVTQRGSGEELLVV